MKNVLYQLIILLFSGAIVSAQNINHFNYKVFITKSAIRAQKTGLGRDYDVVINDSLVKVSNKSYNGGKLLSSNTMLYDLSTNLRIAIYENNSYNVDIIDSIYKPNCRLISTGETKTIKGMLCEKYQFNEPVFIKFGISPYAFGMTIGVKQYSFWITKEIQIDKRINAIILKGITKFFVNQFEGALVQIDYDVTDPKSEVYTDMGLDIKEIVKIDETNFLFPWKSGDKYRPIIADPYYRDISGNQTTTKESNLRFVRQKEILKEITGNPNQKFVVRSIDMSE
jgi:hypothetical protein